MKKPTRLIDYKETAKEITKKIHPYFSEYGIFSAVPYYLGIIMVLLGFLLFVPALVAYIFDGITDLAIIFFYPGILSITIGLLLMVLSEKKDLYLGAAITLAALAWLVVGLMGALPFWLAETYFPQWGLSFVNSVFESMSGFTATGLDMYGDRVEDLPYSFHFWRSLTQWVGGVGVIVLFLSILVSRTGTIANKLYSAEGRDQRLVPSVIKTTRRIWVIYGGFTIALAIILIFLGKPISDSINHSMTALATGGFSVRNESIMAYNNLSYEIAIMPFMIIGGISFVMHYQLLRGKVKEFFKNMEVRAMLIIILIGTAILGISLGLRYSSFQTITALTGTGFSTDVVGNYTDFQKFFLTIFMIFGGGYGSTASAIKLLRVVIIFYSFFWIIKKYILPDSVIVKMNIGDKHYNAEVIQDVAVYVILYMGLLIVAAMIFMYNGASAADALFEVASAQGNVGLSIGRTGATMAISERITLIIVMWAGRLEIFPILVLITSIFRGRR